MATSKNDKTKGKIRKIASLDPDDFIDTGLVDEVYAEVTLSRLEPYNYGGNQSKYSLALHLELEGFGESEDVKIPPVYYSAGDLNLFVPSMDGYEPAGLTVEQYQDLASGEGSLDDDEIADCQGIYAYQVGKYDNISKSTNLHHFLTALRQAGFDKEKLASGDFSEIEGLKAFWTRQPQRSRKGMKSGEGEADSSSDNGDRKKTILLPMDIIKDKAGKGKSSAASTSTKAKTKARPAASDDDDEPEEEARPSKKSKPTTSSGLDSRVEELLTDAIDSSKSKTLRRENLSAIIIKNLTGSDRANATKLVSDINWIGDSARPWDYDRKAKTLSAKDDDMEEEELEEETEEEEEEESED